MDFSEVINKRRTSREWTDIFADCGLSTSLEYFMLCRSTY